MFSFLLSAVTGVPADLNFSHVNNNSKANFKKKNTKVRKNKKKKGPKTTELKVDADEDSDEKSDASEDENSDDNENDSDDAEVSTEPQPVTSTTSDLRDRISGSPMEALLKEVAVKCEVDSSIVFACMNQLWEMSSKYDDMDTLCRAVEEYKKSHAIEGKPQANHVSTSSTASPNPNPPIPSSKPPTTSSSSPPPPPAPVLTIPDRLELAAQFSTTNLQESLVALALWAHTYNTNNNSQSLHTVGSTASEVFFSSKALEILLTTMLDNARSGADSGGNTMPVKEGFLKLLASLVGSATANDSALIAAVESLDKLLLQVHSLHKNGLFSASGVPVLAEHVGGCIKKALAQCEHRTVQQRVAADEHKLKQLLQLEGAGLQELEQSLSVAKSHLAAATGGNAEKAKNAPPKVQSYFMIRELVSDKLQIIVQNVSALKSTSQQLLSVATISPLSTTTHSANSGTVAAVVTEQQAILHQALLQGTDGQRLQDPHTLAQSLAQLQGDKDRAVKPLEGQLQVLQAKHSSLSSQREQLQSQLARCEAELQAVTANKDHCESQLRALETTFRAQMDPLVKLKESASHSTRGHDGLGSLLNTVTGFEKSFLHAFLQTNASNVNNSKSNNTVSTALSNAALQTAQSATPVIQKRVKLLEESVVLEYVQAERDCIEILLERGAEANEKLHTLHRERQAFIDLALTTPRVQTEEKIAKLEGEVAEDLQSISQLLSSLSEAIAGVLAVCAGNAEFKRKLTAQLSALTHRLQSVQGVAVPAYLQQLVSSSSIAIPATAVSSTPTTTGTAMHQSVGVTKEFDLKALLASTNPTHLPAKPSNNATNNTNNNATINNATNNATNNTTRGLKDGRKNSSNNMLATSKPSAQRPPSKTNPSTSKKPENNQKKKTDTSDAINMLERMAGANSKAANTNTIHASAAATVVETTPSMGAEEKKEDVSNMPTEGEGDVDNKEAPKAATTLKDIQMEQEQGHQKKKRTRSKRNSKPNPNPTLTTNPNPNPTLDTDNSPTTTNTTNSIENTMETMENTINTIPNTMNTMEDSEGANSKQFAKEEEADTDCESRCGSGSASKPATDSSDLTLHPISMELSDGDVVSEAPCTPSRSHPNGINGMPPPSSAKHPLFESPFVDIRQVYDNPENEEDTVVQVLNQETVSLLKSRASFSYNINPNLTSTSRNRSEENLSSSTITTPEMTLKDKLDKDVNEEKASFQVSYQSQGIAMDKNPNN